MIPSNLDLKMLFGWCRRHQKRYNC